MMAIITFSGFRESEGDRSGTEDLYWEVVRHFAASDVTTYHPRAWTANVKNMVGQLSRRGIKRVAIISYSHGQAAATAFARLAYAHNISVDLWLACDPVHRPTWLPRWDIFQPLAFRAMLKNIRIKVPKGVRRVVYARQEVDRPCGHTLVPSTPLTYVQKPIVLPYGHTTIDESPEWHAMVQSELQHWIKPPKADPV
jgi:hypothetical protein